MNGREEETRSSFRTIALLLAIPVVGLAVFLVWRLWEGGTAPKERGPERRQQEASRRDVQGTRAPRHVEEPQALPKVTRKLRPQGAGIVLIIDDLGFDGQPLERVMQLDPNVNCSILPNGTRADEFARRLHASGFEVLCHLPMQPRGTEAPGRNAILTSMSDEEIARTTRENIEAVPYARGVNNHMGSLATTDRRVMFSVLQALPEGMYFIDSRTTGGSIAANVARELNVRTASRQVFLDDLATEAAVRRQLAQLAAAAETHGTAIGIGHPHAVTLRVLAEEMPKLRAQGFRFVRASEVVR